MALRKVANVRPTDGKNRPVGPIVLFDGLVLQHGESAEVDPAMLRSNKSLKVLVEAGWLKVGGE